MPIPRTMSPKMRKMIDLKIKVKYCIKRISFPIAHLVLANSGPTLDTFLQ